MATAVPLLLSLGVPVPAARRRVRIPDALAADAPVDRAPVTICAENRRILECFYSMLKRREDADLLRRPYRQLWNLFERVPLELIDSRLGEAFTILDWSTEGYVSLLTLLVDAAEAYSASPNGDVVESLVSVYARRRGVSRRRALLNLIWVGRHCEVFATAVRWRLRELYEAQFGSVPKYCEPEG